MATYNTLKEYMNRNKEFLKGAQYDSALRASAGIYKRPENAALTTPEPAQPRTTLQEIGNAFKSVGSSLASGTATVGRWIVNAPNSAFGVTSALTNSLINPVLKKLELPTLQNKTLTQAVVDVAKSISGNTPVDMTKIENPVIRQYAENLYKGKGALATMTERTEAMFRTAANKAYDEVKGIGPISESTAKKAIYYANAVANTIPITLLLATPYGQFTFAASIASGNVADQFYGTYEDQYKIKNASAYDVGYALAKANVEIASEMIFSLFGETMALFKGSLAKATTSALPPTVGQIIKALALNSLEEGAEEAIAFPAELFLDWLYYNRDKGFKDYATMDNLKQWGDAAIVGTLAGFLMSTPKALYAVTNKSMHITATDRKLILAEAERVLNKKVDDLTVADVDRIIKNYLGLTPAVAPAATATPPVGATQTVRSAPTGTAAAPNTTVNAPVTGANINPDTITPEGPQVVGETVRRTKESTLDSSRFFEVGGTPLQQANLTSINSVLEKLYQQLEDYQARNDTIAIQQTENAIDTMNQQARDVIKHAEKNPMGIALPESEVPFTAEPVAPVAQAPVAAPAPAAPVSTPATAPTTPAAPTSAQPTTAPRGKVTRADFPTYLGWLQHQRDALTGRASKTPNENERRKLLGERVPEMDRKIKAEQDAMGKGQSTEPAPKAVKEVKKKPEPKPVEVKEAKPKEAPVKKAEAPIEAAPAKGKAKAAAAPATDNAPRNRWVGDSKLNKGIYQDIINRHNDSLQFQYSKNYGLELASDADISQEAFDLSQVFYGMFGLKTVFFNQTVGEKSGINGFMPREHSDLVFMSTRLSSVVEGKSTAMKTVSHEMLHAMHQGGHLTEYMKTVADTLGIKDYDSHFEWMEALRKVAGKATANYYTNLEIEDLRSELASRVGADLFSTAEFWTKLRDTMGVTKADPLFKKILNWFKEVLKLEFSDKTEINAMINAIESFTEKTQPATAAAIKKGKQKAAPVAAPVVQAKPKQVKTKPVRDAETVRTTEVKPSATEAVEPDTRVNMKNFNADAQAFLAEPKRVDMRTADKTSKQMQEGVLASLGQIMRGVQAKKNKAISDVGFNVVDGNVAMDTDMFSPVNDGFDPSILNLGKMMQLYEALGLTQLNNVIKSARSMMDLVNKYDSDMVQAKFKNKVLTDTHRNIQTVMKGNEIHNIYIGVENLSDIKGTVRIGMKLSDGTKGSVYFAAKPLTKTAQQQYDLAPIVEGRAIAEATAPVVEPVAKPKAIKSSEVKAPSTVATVVQAKTYDTVEYPDAKMTTIKDTDKGRYYVTIDTAIESERKNLLDKLGFKLNTRTKQYGIPLDGDVDAEQAVRKLAEGLAKIEQASKITVVKGTDTSFSMTDSASFDIGDVLFSITSSDSFGDVQGGNSDAIKTLHENRQFKDPKDNRSLVKEAVQWVREIFTRGATPELDRAKYGEIRLRFIQAMAAGTIASSTAEGFITMYATLTPEEYSIMTEYVVLADAADDARNNRLKNGLPMNFQSVDELYAEFQARHDAIMLDGNPEYVNVKRMVIERKKMLQSMRNWYTDMARKIGYDASVIFTHEEYMHHAIQDFEELIKRVKAGNYGMKKTWLYEQRNNVSKPYLTDPALSDYITLHQMFTDIKRMELFEQVQKLDRSKEFPPMTALPDGYVEASTALFGVEFPEDAIKRRMKDIATEQAKIMGLTGATKAAFIKKGEAIQMQTRLVIPVEIAKTAQQILAPHEKSRLDMISRRVVRQWKAMMIKWPHRLVNYNVRNFAGDLDALLAAYPKAILKIGQAYKELFDYFTNKGTTPNMRDYVWCGGLTTGLAEVEMSSFQKMPSFTWYGDQFKSDNPKTIVNALKQTAKKFDTLDKITQFREQLLRYATYLYMVETELNNEDGLPSYYGASYAPEIQAITTVRDRAYKLSNDALGAYNDVSMFGAWVSDHLIPFWRFKEINMVRYFRLLRNTFYTDNVAVARAGMTLAQKLGVAGRVGASGLLRLGRLAVTGSIITMLQIATNGLVNYFGDDEEKDLPTYVKDTIHLYLGQVNGRSYYFTGLGAISDLVNFFGIDTAIADYKAIVSGRMTIGELAKNLAIAPAQNTIDQMFPIFKLVFEPMSGVKTYPEAAPIRNIPEHIASALGFKSAYRLLSAMPDKQLNAWQSIVSVFGNSSETEYAVYWQSKELVDNYLKDAGREPYKGAPNTTDKGNSIYYFKEAIRLGDKKSAERYIMEYILNGGTPTSYKASMATMHPLQSVPNAERRKFYDNLQPSEKQTVDRAIAFYERMISDGSEISGSILSESTGTSSSAVPSEFAQVIEEFKKSIGK